MILTKNGEKICDVTDMKETPRSFVLSHGKFVAETMSYIDIYCSELVTISLGSSNIKLKDGDDEVLIKPFKVIPKSNGCILRIHNS